MFDGQSFQLFILTRQIGFVIKEGQFAYFDFLTFFFFEFQTESVVENKKSAQSVFTVEQLEFGQLTKQASTPQYN